MKLKLLFLAIFLCLAAVGGGTALMWNLWFAQTHTPWAEPGAVEKGRLALAAQLADSVKREAEIEKIYWDQPEKLQVLIQAHQQREDKLAGNPAANQIVAHDQQAIDRLQQRIAALEAKREAQAEAEAEAAKQAALEAKQEALAERAAEQGHTAPAHPTTTRPAGTTHP
jgi:hypothetical protein